MPIKISIPIFNVFFVCALIMFEANFLSKSIKFRLVQLSYGFFRPPQRPAQEGQHTAAAGHAQNIGSGDDYGDRQRHAPVKKRNGDRLQVLQREQGGDADEQDEQNQVKDSHVSSIPESRIMAQPL